MDIVKMNKPEVKVQLDKYEDEVCAYEEAGIEEGKIVFYGSSGFTRWSTRFGNKPLEECILGKDGSRVAVNHGIGGSTAEHLLYYYHRLVKPWKPRALVVSTGINDRPACYSPQEIMIILEKLFAWARTDMPGIKIFVTDIRPNAKNLERHDYWDHHCREMNRLLKIYCSYHDDVKLIEINKARFYYTCDDYLTEDGIGDSTKVNRDIFIDDLVHFTPQGYELFSQYFLEQLDEIL